MPELPDVEGFRRKWLARARGKTVRRVQGDGSIVRNTSVQGLGRALSGSTFEDPERLGKWLICHTDGAALLLHFGMTGGVVWSGEEPDRHQHDRLFVEFDDGEIRYRNMRKFGGCWLAHDGHEIAGITGPIGPDAYRVGRAEFIERLEHKRGAIKPALMSQKLVAGLGNLTVDETLWRAHIAPRRAVRSLDESERRAAYSSMRRVLRDSIPEGCVTGKRTWLTGARNSDDPHCPRCSGMLERALVGGRSTYWCPRCQPD